MISKLLGQTYVQTIARSLMAFLILSRPQLKELIKHRRPYVG